MFCSRPRCTLHRIIIVVSIQAELASHLRRVYRHTRADLFLFLCSLFPALDYLYPPRGFFELRGLFHPCGGVGIHITASRRGCGLAESYLEEHQQLAAKYFRMHPLAARSLGPV